MIKRSTLRGAVLYGVALSAFGFSGAANAQTAPATPQSGPQGEGNEVVVVTGSLIKRSAETAPAPVIQVTLDQLLESGQPNLVDYLADIPALSGSTVPEDTTGSNLNDGGLSLLNLRDLGSARTLVLVDGRRHVGAAQGSLAVDIDTIPRLLIDSVDIVTGGQSSLYGADAVSGVVNFIMKDHFDGLEVDGALSQINQDGQLNRRLSMLAGKNFFDDRLNVYLSAEYEKGDQVTDQQVDFRAEGWALQNVDSDPASAPSDGVFDNILLRGARDPRFTRGGTIVLGSQTQASPAADPDIPTAVCGLAATTTFRTSIAGNTNCFAFGRELNADYVLTGPGQFRLVNFGTYEDENGVSRPVNVGGDGLNVGTEFSQGSRIPESKATRIQTGGHFDIFNWLTAYGEYKYATEETYDEGQPTFFQGGIANVVANQSPLIVSSSNFNVGLDNAYIPAGLKTLISSNTRPVQSTAGVITGTVAAPYASFNIFGPIRDQLNERTVQRFVTGFRGGWDDLGFGIKDFSYNVGYTYGELKNKNKEHGVDSIRFALSADAVVDTAGALGTPGAVVCRATLQVKQGIAVADQLNGGTYSASNPVISQCKPTNIFGVDLRDNSQEAAGRAYWDAAIHVKHTNIQQDFLATASTKLWDFWGAGAIGVAAGYEARKEKAAGIGRSAETAGRLLFLNTGADFPTAKYSTDEYFGEIEIPLLKDLPFAKYVEVDAAWRKSDYTTVGKQETKNFSAQWRPIEDIMFRTSYGTAIRVPSLTENFSLATQTFANGLTDPCDAVALRNFTATDPGRGANRRANCQTLLGGNYNPDLTQIVYSSGVSGFNSGNPFLKPEESRSWTESVVITPRWWKETSLVIDYYNIKITDAIASVTAQQALNQCVTEAVINPNACAVLTRNNFLGANNADNFKLTSFIQGSLNYAATLAQGIDFSFNSGFDTKSIFAQDWGHVNFNLRGNYLIRQQDFTNIADKSIASDFDSTIGLPRVRYLLTTTFTPTALPKLKVAWSYDWQAPQEILDHKVLATDQDNRDVRYYNTTPFAQSDLTFTYDVTDSFRLRGGVVNVFDQEPDKWLGSTTTADNFDLFGRRFFIGGNLRY